jgi:predicted dinucleotide-binding enzyme
MNIGIIGSGSVAQHLGFGLIQAGNVVKLGTRNPRKLDDWLERAGKMASVGSFEEAAKFGELVIIATLWRDGATRNAINQAGVDNLAGKVVMDVTNPLISGGEKKPPTLALGYPDSAGKTIQEWIPQSRVVKAFNIITAQYMANPHLKQGTPDMFIAGNDPSGKKVIMDIAVQWGWNIHDIGGIEQSYLLEAFAMLWIRYGFINGTWKHAFKLLKE